MVGMLKERQK
jgi:hypothetical protein